MKDITNARNDMLRHGISKPFWITEIGWWGSGYKIIDGDTSKASAGYHAFRGENILTSSIHRREDSLRAVWMTDLFPRVLSIPGCEKVFLWCAMDEYEGGFRPSTPYYAVNFDSKEDKHPLFDLWGIIDGAWQWKKSAYVLRDMLRSTGKP